MTRHILAYTLLLAVFLGAIGLVLHIGPLLSSGNEASQQRLGSTTPVPSAASSAPTFLAAIGANFEDPLSHLLLQAVVIIVAAGIAGRLARLIGQPRVVGEMLAGIVLGPSLLGWIAPSTESFLFPPASFGTLGVLSQIGVVLFMFVVGMSVDVTLLRREAHRGVMISHASILFPFLLGCGICLFIYRFESSNQVPFATFAMFLGVCMSITAFPVLARIIQDRGLSGSPLGTMALACAAIDDATAWCILAGVIALARSGGLAGAIPTILLTLGFGGLMLFVVRPAADRQFSSHAWNESQARIALAVALVFLFASALFTQLIGIHALFGAFLAGVATPTNAPLRAILRERLEAFGSVFLLPIFFAFTGLRTQIGLMSGWRDWLLCAGLILIAIVGKFIGGALAARWTGMTWLDSLSIGTLMNARGLVELIALNIGYDLHILSPSLFTMLVLMALTTTFMTGPVLSWIGRVRRGLEARVPEGSVSPAETPTEDIPPSTSS